MTDLLGPASAPNAVTTRVAEYRTFGNIDTWFKPCSSPASQDGTQLQAPVMNGILAQLRGAVRGNGQLANATGPVVPEVNTNDLMLLGAIQLLIARGQPNAGADTGTADALAVAPATLWPEYKAGARIWVIKSVTAGANLTTTPTVAVSGLAAATIVRRDGSALLPGDLPAGVAFCAEFDGISFRLVSLTWGEIAAAVQSGKWIYGVATGNGNAATVTLFPSQAPVDGTEILVKWPAANTVAAPTFLLTNFVVKTVVRQGGGQIQPGDLAGYVPLIWDATLGAWRVNGFVTSDISTSPYAGTRAVAVFLTSGTWTPPAGVYFAKRIRMWGAGGGGGGSYGSGGAGSGGGGGYYLEKFNVPVAPGTGYAVTVGTPGPAGSSSPTAGGAGTNSSFSNVCTAGAGTGGAVGNSAYATMGGQGGGGINPDFGVNGGGGGTPFNLGSTPIGGIGAASPFGGAVPSLNVGTQGSPGYFPGGGGNAGAGGNMGGAGAAGLVIIEY